MKRYQLIQTYPGSPELNTTVIGCNYFRYKIENTSITQPNIARGDIENNPKYWEEIVEKEYEILSIMPKNENNFKGIIFSHNCNNLLDYLINGDYKIQSVKRLSDGQIFSVGDKISYSYNYPETGIITKDYIIEKIYFIETPRLGFYVGGGLSLGIKSIKIKKLLFKTEDGVDIFEGNEYFSVYVTNYTKDCIPKNNFVLKVGINGTQVYCGKHYNHIVFSTKEKAEKYIIMNKPCLSLNDVATVYITANETIDHKTPIDSQTRKIRKLVQSKL